MQIPAQYILASASVMLALSSARAGILVYSASDPGASSSDARPNSAAKATEFEAAAASLGAVSLVTFESASLGSFSSLVIAPGVTLSGTDRLGGDQTIRNIPDGAGESDAIYGYNTTLGGSRFAYMRGGTLTFSFNSGVQAFGANISGIQFSGETITFSDGTQQSVDIPGLTFLAGGIAFVGFTDAGKSIASITIHATGTGGPDFLGIDDVRYVASSPTPVPEPSTLASAGISVLAGLSIWIRRRIA